MANASDYWNDLERFISQWFVSQLPAKLVEAGWADPKDQEALQELLEDHRSTYAETDYDSYCDCGKWLESGYYEHEDHLSAVLEDSGLVRESPCGSD